MTYTREQQEIYSMLTECTGVHICDSGGHDDRHWQRNQKKTIDDFNNEEDEQVFYSYKYKWFERNVSVFHYLSQLEFDDKCDKFNAINRDARDWDGDEYGVSEAAQKYLNELRYQATRSFNTYNGESDLSQTLQGTWIEVYDSPSIEWGKEEYLLLQIHNGADVRGGYTNARMFKPREFGFIHEYLREFMDSDELREEILDDYIVVFDEKGNEIDGHKALEDFDNQ